MKNLQPTQDEKPVNPFSSEPVNSLGSYPKQAVDPQAEPFPRMKVAVVGAGNSGCAHAFKLAERGHEVRLIKSSHALHDDNFEQIVRAGGIRCVDDTEGGRESFLPLDLITRDMAEGVGGADVVLILTQSLQHRHLAQRIAPMLGERQIVWLIPGNMGSALFASCIRKSGGDGIFAESESTPYDARIIEPGTVNILFRNVRNAVAFHDRRHEACLPRLDALFGCHKYLRTNIFESALHNPNLIVHTVGTIMSASRIEQAGGEFWMYRESFSPSVWNLVSGLDMEKNRVIEAYGGCPESYLDACKWRNEADLTRDSLSVFRSYAEHGGPKGPANLNTRFLYEDVPMGLCLLETLASLKKIPTPLTTSLIHMANALMQTDYRATAYTAEELGL